jgi:flagellar assembly protein FliH
MNEQNQSWEKDKKDAFEPIASGTEKDNRHFEYLQSTNTIDSEFIPIAVRSDNQKRGIADEDSIKDAQGKAAQLEQEAYEKGFAQGERDGFELGEKKAAKFVEKIENLFMESIPLKDEIIKQHEKEILDLIFAVAGKIVHHQIEFDESIVKDTILSALKLSVQKSKIVIRVNPKDYDFVEKLRPDLFMKFNEVKSIIISSDQSISRGGCFLETPGGDVDARVEAQLEKIRQSLEENMAVSQ